MYIFYEVFITLPGSWQNETEFHPDQPRSCNHQSRNLNYIWAIFLLKRVIKSSCYEYFSIVWLRKCIIYENKPWNKKCVILLPWVLSRIVKILKDENIKPIQSLYNNCKKEQVYLGILAWICHHRGGKSQGAVQIVIWRL